MIHGIECKAQLCLCIFHINQFISNPLEKKKKKKKKMCTTSGMLSHKCVCRDGLVTLTHTNSAGRWADSGLGFAEPGLSSCSGQTPEVAS